MYKLHGSILDCWDKEADCLSGTTGDLDLHCYCQREKGLQLCTFPTTKQKIKIIQSNCLAVFYCKPVHSCIHSGRYTHL